MNYFPFQPTKGEAFRLYFTADQSYRNDWISSYLPDYSGVSKDGATFDATVNSVVQITPDPAVPNHYGKARFYIDLTADEMNCDVLYFMAYCDEQTVPYYVNVAIYTSGVEFAGGTGGGTSTATSAFSPAVFTTMMEASRRGYVVSQQDIDNNGYNYYLLIKSQRGDRRFIIIKEKTDFTSVGYRQKYTSIADAWTNRTTLSYASSVKIR